VDRLNFSPASVLLLSQTTCQPRKNFVNSYQLNPYVHVVENCIFPGTTQYGVFHQCTGEVFEASASVRSLLYAIKLGSRFSFGAEDLQRMGDDGRLIKLLIDKEFLVSEGHDPLAAFVDHFVQRPIQNPAVAYRSATGDLLLVRTSMAQRIFSPGIGELPKVIEESLEAWAAALFLAADGTKTLAEIFAAFPNPEAANPLADRGFRKAVEFLTQPSRQLIKFSRDVTHLRSPFSPCNIVPRNMYRSGKEAPGDSGVADFHSLGIDDAAWEFDFIEPTINHGFRFPSDALGGLDFGARFCAATLRADVLPLLGSRDQLQVLEVGGGTGTFARSFIGHVSKVLGGGATVNYQIVDLSPVLIHSQREKLSAVVPPIQHFQQDATELNLPGRTFDLIISNEVIADFPVAPVTRRLNGEPTRNGLEWQGAGASYLEKYELADVDTPDSFLLNTGAIQFLEKAWHHLAPGGAMIVSEYGGESEYPVQAYHLNHEEFSIHFGHLKKCAERIGFNCRLLRLQDFLEIDDQALMLDGQEEQIMCLNHIFRQHGQSLPFALLSEREFQANYRELGERIELTGVTFSPLSNGFHFGPRLGQFMVLVMNKPR
jgi:hypothetical protein